MSGADWQRWFDRYGADYADLDEARADFERYLVERETMRAVFGA